MNQTTGGTRAALLGRRSLLSSAVAVTAGLAQPSRGDVVAVRKDVARLTDPSPLLTRLDAAIGEMQRRSEHDAHDPKGWRAHAMDHDAVCAAVGNGDDTQVHGCWWFLPWHRAFLAVTEWKLRALSGDPSLALPYWNWSNDRRIPEIYQRSESTLARATRYTPDRPLISAEVDYQPHDPALARLGVGAISAGTFQAKTTEQIPSSFGGIAKPNQAGWHGRSRLETVPHNAIHNYVGGEAPDGRLGDMTELSTAALDPLFYAHHGNLDRLWEIWRSDPARRATEPNDPAFLQHRFPFLWLDGTIVTVSVADTLDTRRLGYVYDSLTVLRDNPPPAEPITPRPPVASGTLNVPTGAEHCTLRLTGVLSGDRPMSIEIVIARPNDPASAISIGAVAIGRRHGSAPTFPDTEPRFDVTTAVRLLATPQVTVSVLPLSLGAGRRGPPPFAYASMVIDTAPV